MFKFLSLALLLNITFSMFSQNHNRLFKYINESDFQKANELLIEIRQKNDTDSALTFLAEAMMFSNRNYNNYNAILSYEKFISFLKTKDIDSKKLDKTVDKFDYNIENIKTDIENKVYEFALSKNDLSTYSEIINLCYDCNYLAKAKIDFDNIEFSIAIKQNSISEYNKFIEKYPNSIHLKEIVKSRDLIEFNLSKVSLNTLKEFISKYPQSEYIPKALTLKDSIINNFECLEYHPNGQLKNKGKYKEGAKIGKWISYFENGQIESISNYLINEFTTFNGDGSIKSKKNHFEDDDVTELNKSIEANSMTIPPKKDGKVKCYSEFNGKLYKIENYLNGKLNGEINYYNDKGILYRIENYLDGKLNGVVSELHNGKLMQIGKFSNDYRVGEWTIYLDWDNPKVVFKGTFSEKGNPINLGSILSKGYKEPKIENKRADAIADEANFFDTESYPSSSLQGECVLYYSSGEILFKGNFTNGRIEYHYPNGKIFMIENYKNGELNGEKIEYFINSEDGITQIKKNYLNSKTTKVEVFFEDERNVELVAHEIYFALNEINVKEISFELIFYKNNQVFLKGYYINDPEAPSERIFASENLKEVKDGKVVFYNLWNFSKYEGNYSNGKKNGEWILYLSNGQIIEKGKYINDKKSGIWVHYYDNGKIRSIYNYRNGELDCRME